MKHVLCGRRKALREWLELFWNIREEQGGVVRSRSALHLFRSPNEQGVTEQHMDELRASGLML